MHLKYMHCAPLLADKRANLYMSMVIKSTNTLFLSQQCMPHSIHMPALVELNNIHHIILFHLGDQFLVNSSIY